MTKYADVKDDSKYKQYLDNGFIGIADYMGSDAAIVQAARTSYGAGTKTKQTDRGLIRYLIRHDHWTPVEMCEVKLHLKVPIFVMRQLVRHRTANINEESLRYSLPQFDFYFPDQAHTASQSAVNNQGRSEITLSDRNYGMVKWLLEAHVGSSVNLYKTLNLPYAEHDAEFRENAAYDAFNIDDGLDLEFPGIARELSRMVLPVNMYTELYWKCDLRNIFNLLRLRLDPHAQYEIVEMARIMLEQIKDLFPFAIEAFTDYILQSKKFSRMEMNLLSDLLKLPMDAASGLNFIRELYDTQEEFLEVYGLTKREWTEFESKFDGALTMNQTHTILPISSQEYFVEDIDKELLLPAVEALEAEIAAYYKESKVPDEVSDKLFDIVEDLIAKMLPNRTYRNTN